MLRKAVNTLEIDAPDEKIIQTAAQVVGAVSSSDIPQLPSGQIDHFWLLVESSRLAERDTSSIETRLQEVREETERLLEVVETGLPSSAEVNAQIALLDSELTISGTNEGILSKSERRFIEQPVEPFESRDYEQYCVEFVDDMSDFQLRIQRLKLRILSRYLRGAYAEGQKGLDYKEEEKTFAGKLSKITAKAKFQETKLTPQQKRDLVSEMNRRIPPEVSLQHNQHLSQYDAELMYDLSLSMLYGEPIDANKQKRLEVFLERIDAIERRLYDVQSQGELFNSDSRGFLNEESLKQCWEEYRILLKEFCCI